MSLGTVLCFMVSLYTGLKAILLTQSRGGFCQQGGYFNHFSIVHKITKIILGGSERVQPSPGDPGQCLRQYWEGWIMETGWSVRFSPLSGGHWTRKNSVFIPLLLVVTRNIVQILLRFHLHVSVHGGGLMRVMTVSRARGAGRVMESVYLILRQTKRAGPGISH